MMLKARTRDIVMTTNAVCLVATILLVWLTMAGSPFVAINGNLIEGPSYINKITNTNVLRDECEGMAFALQVVHNGHRAYLPILALYALLVLVSTSINAVILVRNPFEATKEAP